ncbi:MAG: class I adenylate-forming enzyme family protein [Pseudomonadota bacterium]
MNLAELLQRHALQRPSHTALSFASHAYSYAALWAATVSLMKRLDDAGLRPGDRVGICLPDSPLHVIAHFAVAGLGACLVPIDHRNTDVEVNRLAAAFGVVRLVVADGRDTAWTPARLLRVGDLITADNASSPSVELANFADTAWLVSLSSGTTGRPKGALVTHRQMAERFATQWVSLGLSGEDSFALVTPLVFGAGRSFAMSTLAAGGRLVLAPPPYEPTELVATINREAATATFLVPTMMRRLLDLPGDGPLFPHLRRLIISGEAFYPDEVRPFQQRLTTNLIGYYASSEGGGVSVLQPEQFSTHGATVGQAAHGVEIDIVDATGASVADGTTGELRYRGPGVTTTALDADGNTDAGNADGWFYPGDLAARDPDGFIALRGRSKDVINRAGINIYPVEIEQTLLGADLVREAVVVGYRAADGRDEIAAFVVADEHLELAALAAMLSEQLAPYKQPRHLEQLDALPRATSGKTNKKALIERAESAV